MQRGSARPGLRRAKANERRGVRLVAGTGKRAEDVRGCADNAIARAKDMPAADRSHHQRIDSSQDSGATVSCGGGGDAAIDRESRLPQDPPGTQPSGCGHDRRTWAMRYRICNQQLADIVQGLASQAQKASSGRSDGRSSTAPSRKIPRTCAASQLRPDRTGLHRSNGPCSRPRNSRRA